MAFPSLFYTLLAFSCLFRQVLERRISLSSTELIIQVVLIRWAGLNLLTCAATLTAFLFLAFCQTKAEYWDISQNLREIEASREASRTPNVAGFGARRLVKQAPSANNGTQKPQFELEGLHGRPIMYPSVLRHIRMAGGFKDDFSHSYLYIGVPVGIHATYSPMISMDLPSYKVLWNIRPQDQAIRGGKDLTLSHKLEECLRAQNEDPSEWAYAYLLTSPCMNDHNNNNNPLAFWYLYNSDKELTALILQLDTSYGERRLWFVRNSLQRPAKGSSYCFQGKFVKDLQVSPFMPLGSDTSYIVDTSDPCASTDGRVNILITLKKGDKTLMTASVKPHSPSLDIPTASTWSSLVFLWKWWWVPMATVVTCRILGQAAKIYLTQRKKIKVQTREEPIKTVTAKPARTVEMTLERYFYKILQAAVESQSHVDQVKYITPGEHSPRVRILRSKYAVSTREALSQPTNLSGSNKICSEIIFQVISPAFYLRFFHYNSPSAALDSELLDDERTRMAWCSNPKQFASMMSVHSVHIPPGAADWRWSFISRLRCRPLATNYKHKTEFQHFSGLSTSDYWVLQNCTTAEQKEYRRALLRVYLGETIGSIPFGSLTDNLELFGLSRDAVLRIHEAYLKTFIALSGIEMARQAAAGSGVQIVLASLALTGLNMWACMKTIF